MIFWTYLFAMNRQSLHENSIVATQSRPVQNWHVDLNIRFKFQSVLVTHDAEGLCNVRTAEHDYQKKITMKIIIKIDIPSFAGDLKEQDKPQSSSTNLTIIVAVSGVVVVAVIVCVTVYLVVRSRNKRRQSNDLNVVT